MVCDDRATEPVDPAVLRLIHLGVHGPENCGGELVWHGIFCAGMLGGVWVGSILFPMVDASLSIAGGWMAVVCVVTMNFVPVCRGLRPA